MWPASATPPPTGYCSVFSGALASSCSSASSLRPVLLAAADDALPTLGLLACRQRDRLGWSRHNACPGNALRAACRGSTARRRDGLRRLARASGVRTLVAGGAHLWDRGCAIRALGVAALGPPRH